jgi:hypothetical protein
MADGYLIEPHSVGMTSARRTRMTPDHKRSVEFDVDYGADEGPEAFRCRLTRRGTLLCLGAYSGQEFRKMAVDKSEIWEVAPE